MGKNRQLCQSRRTRSEQNKQGRPDFHGNRRGPEQSSQNRRRLRDALLRPAARRCGEHFSGGCAGSDRRAHRRFSLQRSRYADYRRRRSGSATAGSLWRKRATEDQVSNGLSKKTLAKQVDWPSERARFVVLKIDNVMNIVGGRYEGYWN